MSGFTHTGSKVNNRSEKLDMTTAKKKAQIIQDLLDDGKKVGMLEYKTVADKLEELELDPEQIDRIYELCLLYTSRCV